MKSAGSFIKRIRRKKENSWGNDDPYYEEEEHSMWRGLKEILKKKLGLC